MKKGIIGCFVFCLSVGLFAGGAVTITATGSESTPYVKGSTNIAFMAEYDPDGGSAVDDSIEIEDASGYSWSVTLEGSNTITGSGSSIYFSISGDYANSYTITATVEVDFKVKDKDGNYVDNGDSFTKDNTEDFDVVELVSISGELYEPYTGSNITTYLNSDFVFPITNPAGFGDFIKPYLVPSPATVLNAAKHTITATVDPNNNN